MSETSSRRNGYDPNSSFGNWLRQRRKALDLTQSDLAHQIACSVTTIQKIEANERRPSKLMAERMADVLAISLDERASFVAFARRRPALASIQQILLHNLPPQPTPFVGRMDELLQLDERLADPTCRLLTLVGPGGIGKTRLALQAAAERIEDFAQGVFFVSLAPVSSPRLIASSIADALKISFYGKEEPEQLVRYLRERQVLLVIDNFEHLLDGVSLLTQILAGAQHVKILATSRERLNVQEEWVLPIEGLGFPKQRRAIEADEAETYSAILLFVQHAHRIYPRFSLADDVYSVIDVCRAVEGMPLGIELAATWLRVMPCSQIAVQIKHSLDFLATPLRNIAERHRSIRAVFDHSWTLLTETERSALMKMSIFRGGFDLESAGYVAGASLSVLVGLLDKSLVRVNAAGRYDMHELVRQYASDRLAESGEAIATAHSHLMFFATFSEQADTYFYGPHVVVWMERVETELDNIRAALQWSVSSEPETGLRLAAALGWFWLHRTGRIEGLPWLETLLNKASLAPISLRSLALRYIGCLIGNLGDPVRGEAIIELSVALARQSGDNVITAHALSALGHVRTSMDDLTRAILPLEEAAGLYRKIGFHYGVGMALVYLGTVVRRLGDVAQAEAFYNEALLNGRKAQSKTIIGWVFSGLGDVGWDMGRDPGYVVDLYEESLHCFRELRFVHLTGVTLDRIGAVAQTQGDYVRAEIYYGECLAFNSGTGHRVGLAWTLALVGGLELARGRAEVSAKLLGAVDDYRSSLRLRSPFGNLAQYERDIASVRVQLGDAVFESAWAEGRAMTVEQAAAYALIGIHDLDAKGQNGTENA